MSIVPRSKRSMSEEIISPDFDLEPFWKGGFIIGKGRIIESICKMYRIIYFVRKLKKRTTADNARVSCVL